MTTVYHDPIDTGSAANASTFNTRFANLDAAIVALDGVLDDLIIDSGTSDAETIAARGGYSVLDDRISDSVLDHNVLYVDATFNGLSAAKRYTTITAALAACTGGETIMIAPGTYTEDITVADDNVKLIGSGAPTYDSGTGRLVNGTIIRGEISLGSEIGIEVRNLGVDLYGVDSTDCISSSNITTKCYRIFDNLALLGNGSAALAHGLYGAGHNIVIRNVRVYDCYHGIAIHGSYVNVSDVYFYRCYGTGLIVKAKDPMTHCEHINITNVVLEGTNVANKYSGAVELQSEDSLEVRYVNVNNVTAEYCINGAIVIDRNSSGAIKHVNISNVVSNHNQDLALVGDFRFNSGDEITLTNCRSINRAAGYGFRTNTDGTLGNIYLNGCYGDSTGSGLSSGTFLVNTVADFVPLMRSVTIADDGFTTFDLALTSGIFILNQGNADGGANMGIFCYRAATTPFCVLMSSNGATNIVASTGALTGTTGTDGKTNVRAHTDGLIYVENRTGSSRTYRLTPLG